MLLPRQPSHQPEPDGRDNGGPGAPSDEQIIACDPTEEASRLHDLAGAWRAQGQYAAALASSQHALMLCEQEVGLDHPDVANVLNTLTGIYEDQGNHAETERLYQRSVVLMEALSGE